MQKILLKPFKYRQIVYRLHQDKKLKLGLNQVSQIKQGIREELLQGKNKLIDITYKFDYELCEEEYDLDDFIGEPESINNSTDISELEGPGEAEYNNLSQWLTQQIDEYVQKNILEFREYKHDSTFVKKLGYFIRDNMKDKEWYDIMEEDELEELIMKQLVLYLKFMEIPRRSHPGSIIVKEISPEREAELDKIINYLENVEQPDQRTDDWYEFRHNLLTASSIWKALDSQSQRNNLILGKCMPIDKEKYSRVNLDSAFEWGHRYEPLSTMLYEKKYDTVIGEFGCIKDTTVDFLGASPDGINIKKGNPRYGRMLEIKNPKSRIISGTPKKDYWVQMQLQMYCCKLEECDFWETKFTPYESRNEFIEDQLEGGKWWETKDGKRKGVIKMFEKRKGGGVDYIYCPLTFDKSREYERWNDKIMDDNEDRTWLKDIYWKLETESCVLVERNRLWMQAALPKFKEIWKIILEERVSGYSHRQPKKRIKKTEVVENNPIRIKIEDPENKKNKEPENKKKVVVTNEKIREEKPRIMVKIRTESFEEFKNKSKEKEKDKSKEQNKDDKNIKITLK